MMGKSHLLLGAAGYLAIEATAPGLLSSHAPTTAELFAGTLICAGAAMLPDIDHPQATVSRSLGVVSETASGFVHKLAGGHRKGTHTVWAWLLVSFVTKVALSSSNAPWIALAIAILCASFMFRILTEASGVTCFLLAAVLGGAAVLATGDNYAWLGSAVFIGYGLHMLGDIVTTEGIPPFYPLGHNIAFPIIGSTDHWRERSVGALCGLIAFYLLLTTVFLPGWRAQTAAHAKTATAVTSVIAPAQAAPLPSSSALATRLRVHVAAEAKLAKEVKSLHHELQSLQQIVVEKALH